MSWRCPSESLSDFWETCKQGPGIPNTRFRCVKITHEVRNLLGCKHFKKPWQVYPICHTDSIHVAGIFCLSVVCQYVGKSINQHLGLPVPDIGSWKNMDKSTTIPKSENHFSIVHLILWIIMIYYLYLSFMVRSTVAIQKKHKLLPDCHVKTIRRPRRKRGETGRSSMSLVSLALVRRPRSWKLCGGCKLPGGLTHWPGAGGDGEIRTRCCFETIVEIVIFQWVNSLYIYILTLWVGNGNFSRNWHFTKYVEIMGDDIW